MSQKTHEELHTICHIPSQPIHITYTEQYPVNSIQYTVYSIHLHGWMDGFHLLQRKRRFNPTLKEKRTRKKANCFRFSCSFVYIMHHMLYAVYLYLSTCLRAGPLWATLGSCGPDLCRPPWARVGGALVGLPGLSWAMPSQDLIG